MARLNDMRIPKILIVTGMYRSGSTRLSNLLRLSIDATIGRHDTIISHPVTIEGITHALDTDSVYLGKTHEAFAETLNFTRDSDIRVALTYRNPIDAATSLVSTFGWSPEFAARKLSETIMDSLELHPRYTTLVPYETAISASPFKIKKLLNSLGIEVGFPVAAYATHQTRRSRFRKISNRLLLSPSTSWDPITLLHPGHVGHEQGKKSGGGEGQMTDSRSAIMNALLTEKTSDKLDRLLERFSAST